MNSGIIVVEAKSKLSESQCTTTKLRNEMKLGKLVTHALKNLRNNFSVVAIGLSFFACAYVKKPFGPSIKRCIAPLALALGCNSTYQEWLLSRVIKRKCLRLISYGIFLTRIVLVHLSLGTSSLAS